VGGQRDALTALPKRKTRYPLYRSLGGHQSRSGIVRKKIAPTGIQSRTFHPVASRYADWTIPANIHRVYSHENKAVPVQVWTGPEGSRRLRLPDFRTLGKWKWFISPTRRPSLPSMKYTWYSFLLEAESTPGPGWGRKDYVNEKFRWHHRKSNPRPSGL